MSDTFMTLTGFQIMEKNAGKIHQARLLLLLDEGPRTQKFSHENYSFSESSLRDQQSSTQFYLLNLYSQSLKFTGVLYYSQSNYLVDFSIP